MKKIIIGASLLFFSCFARSQNGLENITVEIYYVSDANDTSVNSVGGKLPIGSVTYRVYADMLPSYKFQALYGVNTPAMHELRIETTTLFFNNEDRGATTPTYTKAQAKNNTVMLDSWFSMGAACAGNNFGIYKTDDDGVATIVNAETPQVLQNTDITAGIPVKTQDGIIVNTRTPGTVTPVGVTSEIAMFDNQNDGTNGPVFSTFNGSVACLGGAMGPDTVANRVLIGQFTTDGIFSFQLNVQIGKPNGGYENYVASNPVGNEISIPSLTYTNNPLNVKENPSNTLFKVYPNPSADVFTMEIAKQSSASSAKQSISNGYTVYSSQGNVVMRKRLGEITDKYMENIDMSSFAPGQYFIELTVDGHTSAKKLIKY